MPIRMTEEQYTQRYGISPFPNQDPEVKKEIDEAKAQSSYLPPERSSFFANSLSETGGDIKEMFGAYKDTLNKSADYFTPIRQSETLNPVQKTQGFLTGIMKGVTGLVGDTFIGTTKALTSQETEDKAKEKVASGVEKVMSNENVQQKVKSMQDWYNGLDEANKMNVDFALSFAEFASDVGLGGAAKPAWQVTKQGFKEGAKITEQGLKTGARTVGEWVDTAAPKIREARVQSQYNKANEATARIIQGKPGDADAALKALSSIDTQGVKTYKELNEAIQDGIEGYAKKVDEELVKYNDVYRADQLGKYTSVNGKQVVQNPVADALDGLENAYRLSNDLPNATRINQIKTKLANEGLTVKELNDIAREYGTEFKNLSFTKLGEPKAGFRAEGYEATRTDLKNVIRDRLPDDATKNLDKQISDLYRTLDLTQKMEVKVNNLHQKIMNRTWGQKVGGAAANVVDMIGLGTPRGFVQKLLPSNVGLKTANSLDLEKELAKNLGQIDKLLKITDDKQFAEAFVKYLDEVQPGLSTRVTSNMTNEQKDVLLKQAFELDSKDFTTEFGGNLGGVADIDGFARVKELTEIADKRSLTEREYAELRALVDEAQTSRSQTIAPSFSKGEIPEQLLAEARKYKSADEFVKAMQPELKNFRADRGIVPTVSLDDAVGNMGLLKKYPELMDVEIKLSPTRDIPGGGFASAERNGKTIRLSNRFYNEVEDGVYILKEDYMPYLYHELEHIKQMRLGTAGESRKTLDELRTIDEGYVDLRRESGDKYTSDLHEIEASLAERKFLTRTQLEEIWKKANP